jgi:hypothetical protein
MGGCDSWSIEADNTVNAGYTQTFCVKCTNGDQEIEVKDWNVAQNPNPLCATAGSVLSSSTHTQEDI